MEISTEINTVKGDKSHNCLQKRMLLCKNGEEFLKNVGLAKHKTCSEALYKGFIM